MFSRLRKRSIDSRAETDPSRSNENVGLLNNSPCFKRDSAGGFGGMQSNSAASTPTSKHFFGIKSENMNASSTLALTGSITKLNTICETDKSPSKSPMLTQASKCQSLRLADAQSIRQKWIILLAKAQGGVQNIPKAFIVYESDQNLLQGVSVPDNSNSNSNIKIPFTLTKPDDNNNNNVSISNQNRLPSESNFLAPVIYKSSSSNAGEKLSLKSKFSKTSNLDNIVNLDESVGFQLDIDNLELEPMAKTSRSDDGFNKNPQRLLNTLMECRQDLKTEIEKFNSKITKIDKKIIEILQLLTLPLPFDMSSTRHNSNSNEANKTKNSNLLDINNNTTMMVRNRLNDSVFTFGNNSNNNISLNNTQTFSNNSQLKSLNTPSPSIGMINSKSNTKLKPTSSFTVFENNKPTIKEDENNATSFQLDDPNKTVLHTTLLHPTITINEDKMAKPNKKEARNLKLNLNKNYLAGSNASSLASAVAGASSILSVGSSNKSFQLKASLTTPDAIPTAGSGSALTTSNYNVNLIPIETEQKYLKSSVSENLIKETPNFRKLGNDNKRFNNKTKFSIDTEQDNNSFDMKVIKKKEKKEEKKDYTT